MNESVKIHALSYNFLLVMDEREKRKEFIMDELIPKNIIPEFISNDEIWEEIGAKFEKPDIPIKLPSTRLRYSDDEEIFPKFVKVLLPPNYEIQICHMCSCRINILHFRDIIKTITLFEDLI